MTNETSPLKINWQIINWLRGLAALYVVVNHARANLFTSAVQYAQTIKPKASWGLWEWGNIILMEHTDLGPEFVILFFVLSGFSIAHSLNNNTNTLAFYKRRAIRLYPPYLLGILWALFIFLIIRLFASDVYYHVTEGFQPVANLYNQFTDLRVFLQNLFYDPVHNALTPQYWSLPFEVIFYLIAPWVIKKLKWYGAFTLIFYAIGWILKGYIYYEDTTDPMIPQFLTDYNIYFLVGILFYTYRKDITERLSFNPKLSIIVLVFIIEVLVVAKSYLFHQVSNKITGLLMVLFSFIILFTALKHQIQVKWLQKIGIFSYTLYVSHFASIFLINIVFYKLGFSFYHVTVMYAWYIGIILPVVIASILYYFAEYPAIKYLERLRIPHQNN